MKYEVVELKEKIVAGLSARTNNASPDMGAVIGNLWQRFYTPGTWDSIENRVNAKSLGIYTDYSSDEMGDYTIMVGAETCNDKQPKEGLEILRIPAGKYAKFIVKGHMQRAVAEFWQQLWNMDLPRNFCCDFEEYQDAEMENAEIHIYIGLKES